MTDPIGGQDIDQASQAPAPNLGAITAGASLRQVREAAGVHIDALAGALKVPVAKLHALEADDYAAFPDAVFMRALASSMCRVLKVDAAPVLALLPQGAPIQLPPDRAINASFKDSGRRPGRGGSLEQPKSRLLGIAVGVLLVAALVIAFLPMGNSSKDEGVALVLSRSSSPAGGHESAAEQASQAAVPADGVVVQEAPAQVSSAPVVAVPAAAADQTAKTEAAVPEGVLVIRAHKESWVQVRNGAGKVVLQKALAAGDSYSPEGDPPWRVVIGRADAIEVTVRGQPMDLKAVSRENVARFEVK
ncbi:MAG: DUF4115 domain-containing protein [Proteobacteria bacterium]|nr:DUF4115 domain-containing protein [Pseudomonadota bacterium]MBS0492758.1 DUF4115 domain-containing protein [Pseudomonadota bacterium]